MRPHIMIGLLRMSEGFFVGNLSGEGSGEET